MGLTISNAVVIWSDFKQSNGYRTGIHNRIDSLFRGNDNFVVQSLILYFQSGEFSFADLNNHSIGR
jgi:hypothetical protein